MNSPMTTSSGPMTASPMAVIELRKPKMLTLLLISAISTMAKPQYATTRPAL